MRKIWKVMCMAAICMLFFAPKLQAEAAKEWYTVDGIVGGKVQFDPETGTIYDAEDSITTAVIPETIDGVQVCKIGEWAFAQNTNLTYVEIPGSVAEIGPRSFLMCTELAAVKIDDGVETIGDAAFETCFTLRSVDLPESVTALGGYAFMECRELQSIQLPSKLTTIGEFTFAYCIELQGDFVIPEKVSAIGMNAFYWCENLTRVLYDGTEQEWAEISIGKYNDVW